MVNSIHTTCPYCGVGCGLIVNQDDNGAYTVKGDPHHPANLGRLCSKGAALGETLGDENRLLHPYIGGRKVSMDEATDFVAKRFLKTVEKHGPDSVAFYVSGQLLTEDYYVANKLIKGFLGTSNIDTNSRLCMSSSVAGHKRAFGSDTVPQTYEDIEKADLVVLVGSNLAWCHPVLFQRLKAAKSKSKTKIVVIDPRKTSTCEIADLHLAIDPGADVPLFNGLLKYLDEQGKKDQDYVAKYVEGAAEALGAAKRDCPSYRELSQTCALNLDDLITFYKWFSETEKTLTIYSQGVNQSSQGTDKVNAIINCHLYTGRIGKEGCGPLSVTGQPNAMGGREVGGLANMLAAHMDFDEDSIHRVSKFWNAYRMASKPGKKAVDMFEDVYTGKIKAIWIMATNPCVSMPDANKVRQALEKCELVVVSDCIANTDTMKYAHVQLPAATWGERNGTVTNSERVISRQRQFVDLPGEALPDWKIMTKVAHKMGFKKEFPFETSHDVFLEHVALSALDNQGARDFDLSGWQGLSRDEFDAMEPTKWPVNNQPKERFFADGRFYTASQKGKMLALSYKKPENQTSSQFPFVLNTGRIRDQWHMMTRTGLSARLSSHIEEPYLEICSEDALANDLNEGDLAKVSSNWGNAYLRVRISENVKKSHLFMPMHWTDENSANACVGRLVNPVVDPVSGQPESKHTPVKIEKFNADWYGFLVSRKKINIDGLAYWTRSQSKECYIYDLAGQGQPENWSDYMSVMFGEGELISVEDTKRKNHRFALLKEGRAHAILITSSSPNVIDTRQWLASMFELDDISTEQRLSMLSGKVPGNQSKKGRIICSCFNVGLLEIQRAILEQNCVTVEGIGKLLSAGTNCGSCQAEIKTIIEVTSSAGNEEENKQVA